MRRRVLTLAIAVVLICSLFTSFAFAATLRASDYISSYNAVIYSSGTKINVDCSITGTGRMKTIGIKSVKIYTSSGTNVELPNPVNSEDIISRQFKEKVIRAVRKILGDLASTCTNIR